MSAPIRVDLQLIADMVDPATRALDVGCGDGALLAYLVNVKQVDARGMELSQAGVNACVANGLSVVQGDADTDLRDYPDAAFDYVILSQTLQATREPRRGAASRCCASASAPSSRSPTSPTGRCGCGWCSAAACPRRASLPYKWYDTPNIHLCSIDDFRAPVPHHGRAHRARHRAQQQEPPHPAAAAARQPDRRAGGVHAEAGLNPPLPGGAQRGTLSKVAGNSGSLAPSDAPQDDSVRCLFPLVAREHRGQAQPDEQRAADTALDLEIALVAAQPLAGGAGQEGVAAVGDEAERGKQQAEEDDLRREMAALGLDELRQEGEEEESRLGVQQVDDEAVAEQPGMAVARQVAVGIDLLGATGRSSSARAR